MASNVTPMRKQAKAAESPHPLDYLSFVGEAADGTRLFWETKTTGDYTFDCILGKALGQEAVAYFRTHNCKFVLSSIVGDTVKKGVYDGVEIGFMAEIENLIMRGLRASSPAGLGGRA